MTDQLSVQMNEDLKTRLENFSTDNGVSQAGAVRMALVKFLSSQTEVRP